MNISALNTADRSASGSYSSVTGTDSPQIRETFNQFVGETFFGQMLQSMHKTVGKPAYFHGGRAEEAFQGQLDQQLAQQMTKASADSISGPMFDLFQLQRS